MEKRKRPTKKIQDNQIEGQLFLDRFLKFEDENRLP